MIEAPTILLRFLLRLFALAAATLASGCYSTGHRSAAYKGETKQCR